MAAKSYIIPTLRQISSKYVCRKVLPARLFTAYAGELNRFNGDKCVSSANIIQRLFDDSRFQSRNASTDGKSSSQSRKVVSKDEEEEEEDSDAEEFGEGDLDDDEISEDDLDDTSDDSESE